MVYSYLSIYVGMIMFLSFLPLAISLSPSMDTYVTYKPQRTLRVSKLLIDPFLFAGNPARPEVRRRQRWSGCVKKSVAGCLIRTRKQGYIGICKGDTKQRTIPMEKA